MMWKGFRRTPIYGQSRSLASVGIGIVLLGCLVWCPQRSFAHEEEAGILTNHLLQLAAQYYRAPVTEQSAILAHLATIASRRKALLLQEISTDPGAFLLHALPAQARAHLPPEIQELLEEHVSLEGTLIGLRVDDFDHDRTETHYRLEVAGEPKTTYALHFAKSPPGLLSGSTVVAQGVRLDTTLVLEQGSGASLETIQAMAPLVSGNQPTIIMLINFLNDTRQPWTASQVYSTFFTASNSTNLYYQNTSFDHIYFSGDAVGWYRIPYNNGPTCDIWTWATAADAAATSAGVNLSQYTRRVYLFPSTSSCGWAGAGTIGGNPSRTWSNGYNDNMVYAHELGHNVGVHHASSISCGTKAIDVYSNCTVTEYGDKTDTMGGWNLFQFNAPHKVAMGWVPLSRVQPVTTNGTYTIAPLEVNGSAMQALKISKPDTSESYYVSYRQPLGFDATLVS